jgi:acyl dehydratase
LEEEMNFNKYIGSSAGVGKLEYNWRDIALYALAVGTHKENLDYYYEKNLKALPTFGVIPYWNAVNVTPQRPIPYPASLLVSEGLQRELDESIGLLHMEHELIMHRPIDPIKGSLVFEDTITNIYDRGKDKGIIVKTQMPVYDEAGNLICTNKSSTVFFAGGGFGGEKPPRSTVVIPDREPDYVISDYISEIQNVVYRLTGDTNHLHVNPEVAQEAGFKGPIMQGLCSFGFAGRMGIEAIIPNMPERMTRITAQMRSVCYPGTKVQFVGWEIDRGVVYFKLLNSDTAEAILDKGVFVYI